MKFNNSVVQFEMVNMCDFYSHTKSISFIVSFIFIWVFKFNIQGLLIFNGEFDPGSGWMLAACLIHASRAVAWLHRSLDTLGFMRVVRFEGTVKLMTSGGPERVIGQTGTETRPRLLREAAVGNLSQWAKAWWSNAACRTKAFGL